MSPLYSSVEPLEARIAPATLYVGKSEDLTITLDTGVPGLSAGDTVTWDPGSASAHGAAVTNLVFGTTAFLSVSEAVTAAGGGDVIRVGPGVFTETVTVSKWLTILGNQNGIDARGRTSAEETIFNSAAGAFIISAGDVTVDGFVIENQRDANGSAAVVVLQGAAGFDLQNSILRDNATALDWNNPDGSSSTVQRNVFEDNFHGESGSGRAIVSSTGLYRGTLKENLFVGAHGSETVSLTSAPQTSFGTLVENNEFQDGNNLVLKNFPSVSVVNNTFSGVQTGLPSAPDGILILDGTSGGFYRNTFTNHNVSAIVFEAHSTGGATFADNTIVQDLSLYHADTVAAVQIIGGSSNFFFSRNVVQFSGAQSDSSGFEAAVLLKDRAGTITDLRQNQIELSTVQFDTTGAKQIVGLKIVGSDSPGQTFNLRENGIIGAEVGLHLTGLPSSAVFSALGNSFAGKLKAVQNDSDATVDARFSWFGTAKKASVAKAVIGDVLTAGFAPSAQDQSTTRTGFQSAGVLDLRNPKAAVFTDMDGDRVTVKTNRGSFVWDQFSLSENGVGFYLYQLSLDLNNDTSFAGASISLSAARKGPMGDGFASIYWVLATGIDLRSLSVDGDLTAIRVGDDDFTTPGLGTLRVWSLGFTAASDVAGNAPLTSQIKGDLGQLLVKDSLTGVSLKVTGDADSGIGVIKIGGDLMASHHTGTGVIQAAGDIGSVSIGGSVVALSGNLSGAIVAGGKIGSVVIGDDFFGNREAESGRIVAGTTIGKVKIGGTMRGAQIIAGGLEVPATAKEAVAIGSVAVGKDVLNSQILAGFDGAEGAEFKRSDVQIGAIKVRGGWHASDVSAGVDSVDGYFGNEDDSAALAGDDTIVSRIASITIGKMVTGIGSLTDQFGFVAEQIGSFTNGKHRLALSDAIDFQVYTLARLNSVHVREV